MHIQKPEGGRVWDGSYQKEGAIVKTAFVYVNKYTLYCIPIRKVQRGQNALASFYLLDQIAIMPLATNGINFFGTGCFIIKILLL